jgi:hypothetical protein
MTKLLKRLTTLLFAAVFVVPIIGCQPKPVVDGEPKDGQKAQEPGKAVNIKVDAGKTKVKIESEKKPGDEGRHLDVDVQHNPGHEREPGESGK